MSSTYKCEVCGREFGEDDFKHYTKDKNKCILHCEKESFSGNKVKLRNEFYRVLDEKLNNQNSENSKSEEIDGRFIQKEYLFEKMIFPKIQSCTNNYEYDGVDIIIQETDYSKNFLSLLREHEFNILFKDCVFLDSVTFEYLDTEMILSFENCQFKKKFTFDKDRVNFMIVFKDCTFHNKIDLENTIFLKILSFYDCFILDVLNINNTIYNDRLIIKNVSFNKEYKLDLSRIQGKTEFLNLNTININTKSSYYDNEYLQTLHKLDLNVSNRETARIIKDSFEQQNNIIEANKYYAIEMQKREEELDKEKKNGKNFFEWLVFKTHGLASNHSQDWILSLLWIFLLGFFASYYDFNLITDTSGNYVNFNLINIYKTFGMLLGIYLLLNICNLNNKRINLLSFTISYYLVYIYATNDYLLELFSKTINPFSVMRNNDPINGIQLVFKIIIAFLIYQFIISIRQNTKRK